MSASKPLEQRFLSQADAFLSTATANSGPKILEHTYQILEAVSSHVGGFSLREYFDEFGIEPHGSLVALAKQARNVVALIEHSPICPALALSSLAREPLSGSARRTTGAYYTDFRLAQFLAQLGSRDLTPTTSVVDMASGSGGLLAAVAVEGRSKHPRKLQNWLAHHFFAMDSSANALRGARIALSSFFDDVRLIRTMWQNWRCHDSLMAPRNIWTELAPTGFDLIVGNPPWEKVKLTKHEYLKSNGTARHYGDEYSYLDTGQFEHEKRRTESYARALIEKYGLSMCREPDLYMAFLQLAHDLLSQSGRIAMLLPAGLIRSQGTEQLRNTIMSGSRDPYISVIDNRSHFFDIDSRFKFIALSYARRDKRSSKLPSRVSLSHATGSPDKVSITSSARLAFKDLRELRPDLSIPEVHNDAEWRLLKQMHKAGIDWSKDSSGWRPQLVREIDMTRQRRDFTRSPSSGAIPVVEGRMVSFYRLGAKSYIAGTGRRARWHALPIGRSKIAPQFWISRERLPEQINRRVDSPRAGFCDIAGQTNERAMTAAIISPGLVCGNKVPTLTFPGEGGLDRLYLWIAMVNSFAFDWILRRVITTTVNYFVLLSVPLPAIRLDSEDGKAVVRMAKRLHALDSSTEPSVMMKAAKLRAEIDVVVLRGYGLGMKELELILRDFPLLDRGQPALPHEKRSTITRDFLVMNAARRLSGDVGCARERARAAMSLGAIPYIPSEFPATTIAAKKRPSMV